MPPAMSCCTSSIPESPAHETGAHAGMGPAGDGVSPRSVSGLLLAVLAQPAESRSAVRGTWPLRRRIAALARARRTVSMAWHAPGIPEVAVHARAWPVIPARHGRIRPRLVLAALSWCVGLVAPRAGSGLSFIDLRGGSRRVGGLSRRLGR